MAKKKTGPALAPLQTVEGPRRHRIQYMDLDELLKRKHPDNSKLHDQALLEEMIADNGFVSPPLLDERTGLLAFGHGRLDQLAAMKAASAAVPEGIEDRDGAWMVPVILGVSFATEDALLKYLVGDNRSVERGGWNNKKLVEALSRIGKENLRATGFGQSDFVTFLARLRNTERSPEIESEIPPLPKKPIAKRGDLWILGKHRLLCGDSRQEKDVAMLLGKEKIDVAITSPPYASQRDYDLKSEFKPIPPDEYIDWIAPAVAAIANRLAPSGSWFLNIKEHCEDGQRVLYVKDLVLKHVREWGWRLVDEFCWRNTKNGVPGGWNNRFKNAWEPIFHFARQSTIKFFAEAVSENTDQALDYSPDTPRTSTGSGS